MIDHEDLDVDFIYWGGLLGLIGLIVFMIMWWCAHLNDLKCTQMQCRNGEVARLLDHQCLCVDQPIGPVQ